MALQRRYLSNSTRFHCVFFSPAYTSHEVDVFPVRDSRTLSPFEGWTWIRSLRIRIHTHKLARWSITLWNRGTRHSADIPGIAHFAAILSIALWGSNFRLTSYYSSTMPLKAGISVGNGEVSSGLASVEFPSPLVTFR